MALQGAGYKGWEDEFEAIPTRDEQGGQDTEAVVEEVEAGGKIRVGYCDNFEEEHEKEAQILSVTVSLEADETLPRRTCEGRHYSIQPQSQQPGLTAQKCCVWPR
ncbi:hypothetical protein AC578_3923 [Pseudocercospora eumusae]|uniref:Uncharacterized protein n=1 Tax=Pseudocercospora eumusae TaxID=321146 RepID=A0A139H0N5_9PEZI|nr:hypothetical protein AC578_3923 [Pseudocercospora eumusae]